MVGVDPEGVAVAAPTGKVDDRFSPQWRRRGCGRAARRRVARREHREAEAVLAVLAVAVVGGRREHRARVEHGCTPVGCGCARPAEAVAARGRIVGYVYATVEGPRRIAREAVLDEHAARARRAELGVVRAQANTNNRPGRWQLEEQLRRARHRGTLLEGARARAHAASAKVAPVRGRVAGRADAGRARRAQLPGDLGPVVVLRARSRFWRKRWRWGRQRWSGLRWRWWWRW